MISPNTSTSHGLEQSKARSEKEQQSGWCSANGSRRLRRTDHPGERCDPDDSRQLQGRHPIEQRNAHLVRPGISRSRQADGPTRCGSRLPHHDRPRRLQTLARRRTHRTTRQATRWEPKRPDGSCMRLRRGRTALPVTKRERPNLASIDALANVLCSASLPISNQSKAHLGISPIYRG